MRCFVLMAVLLSTPVFADDHVVVLLDTSASMSERMRTARMIKMDAAQRSLQKVVDQMPQTTKMGLLTFNGWAIDLGDVDKIAAQKAIAKTYPNGGTPLGTYMKMGADKLLEWREKNHGVGTYTLLVVTDGEATPSLEFRLMEKYTPEIVSRGIILKTIGLDLRDAHTLSSLSNKYFSANDLNSLEGALNQAIAEVPSGNDNIEDDAYAMVSGIPNKMASGVIQTLVETIMLNHPIGEKPKIKVVDQSGSVSLITPEFDNNLSNYDSILIFIILFFMVICLFLIVVAIFFSIARRMS